MVESPSLNCDLGEWETPETTAEIMSLIDWANIACGGHAGDETSMRYCLDLAAENGVKVGAHPGLIGNQGRATGPVDPNDFRNLLENQLNRFLELTVDPHHVKLHGSLYHLSEADERIREIYFQTIQKFCPELTIVGLAGGKVIDLGRAAGLKVAAEVFLDRGYQSDGSLVPRGLEGSLIHDNQEIIERIHSPKWACNTFCVHSDSPNSIEVLQTARQALLSLNT